jgi:integrase
MRLACERARITPSVGFHGLRHTWASHAVMNRVPLLVVAKNLGHADSRMVEKHYGHLAPSYIADAIRAGAPKFGFKPDPTVTPLRR